MYLQTFAFFFDTAFKKWYDDYRKRMKYEVTAMLWKPIAEALLEDSDRILYVTRIADNRLIYINGPAKLECGLPEDDTSYEGQLCHKLLHGYDEPCPHCKRSMINRQDFYRWRFYHEADGMHYWVKDKIITINGEDCHLQLAEHMTEQLENERKIQRELEKKETARPE